MKRKIPIDVTARFTFTAEIEMADDEEGLSSEEEGQIEDAVMQALAGFKFRGVGIAPEDPPAVEIDTSENP